MQNIPMIGIAAPGSNMGKTHLLLALLREFAVRGLRVAVLKHGQHVYLPPDKDSSLFMQAGAAAALVVSPGGWLFAAAPQQEPDFASAAAMLAHSCKPDLLLVEGYKQGPQPKLLLARQTLNAEMLLPHTRALISDEQQCLPLPCFRPADSGGIASFIMENFMGKQEGYDE